MAVERRRVGRAVDTAALGVGPSVAWALHGAAPEPGGALLAQAGSDAGGTVTAVPG
ncbi:hypothetical protein SAMN05414137_103421 [Streptacidiphilus jiangxiensis]|uniref:Uncharacterized protein n=1 Tax=Streptacidiphilus jiangxiensis TaxID=235985 RepID=A0A1H7JQW9_STRJI|nr:hypothetical protein SAMN05414137_103421 [Streptacidiphilus jiangxiensis]